MGAKMNRFSEDIDLTYDIRELVPDLLQGGNPIPVTASQEKKITSAVRSRLPEWIAGSVMPVLENSLISSNAQAELRVDGKDSEKLIIDYLSGRENRHWLRCGVNSIGVRCPRDRRAQQQA